MGRSPTWSTNGAGWPRCSRPRTTRRRRCGRGSPPCGPAGSTCWPTARRWPPTPCWRVPGAPTALVTTEGFADVIEIARQDRPRLYDHWADRPPPLVDRDQRLEVGGRLAADGAELEPVGEVPEVPTGADGGRRLPAARRPRRRPTRSRWPPRLRGRGHEVSASHEVSPEFREYERTVTTVVNAGLGPVCRALPGGARAAGRPGAGHDLGRRACPRSAAAARTPAGLLLSGPAGGVRAAAALRRRGRLPGRRHLRHGRHQHRRGPRPRRRAAAGGRAGGRRATRSASRRSTCTPSAPAAARSPPSTRVARSTVGPRSAGAVPGPGLLRLGGTEPTVTDANLVAGPHPGRASASRRSGALDEDAAAAALERLGLGDAAEAAADGVLEVVDAAHGAGRAPGVGRAGRRPGRARPGRLRRGRARCTPAAWPTGSGWPPWSSRPGPGCCPRSGCWPRRSSTTGSGPGPRPTTTTASPPRWPSWARRRSTPSWPTPAGPAATSRSCWPSTPATRARATSCGCRPSSDFAEAHRRQNGYDRPGHPSRSSPCGPAPAGRRRSTPPGSRARAQAAADVGPGRGGRGRHHDLGAPRAGRASPGRPAPSC